MNSPEVHGESVVDVRPAKSRYYRPGLALALNFFALFVYAFALIGPLLPSHGLPPFGILLAFVGGPSVVILVASRLCQSLGARIFCCFAIALIVGFSTYMYLKLASMIGRST
jgi:Ni/Fe-hydrogenase subunit HybB-like protein